MCVEREGTIIHMPGSVTLVDDMSVLDQRIPAMINGRIFLGSADSDRMVARLQV